MHSYHERTIDEDLQHQFIEERFMSTSIIKKIRTEELAKCLSLIVLLTPTFIMHYNITLLVFLYLPVEILSILYLEKSDKWKISHWKYLLFIIVLEIVVIVSTFMNQRISYSYICMVIAEIYLVIHIINNIKYGLSKLIIDFSSAFRVIWIIDIISVVIKLLLNTYSNSEFGFVGHKNYHAFLFILVIGIEIMANIICGHKAIDGHVVIISVINIIVEFIVSSFSGVVSILVLILLCFFTKNRLKILNLSNIFIGLLILNYVLIFTISSSTLMRNLLEFVGRDIGMSGRRQMWELAISLIETQPFRGYGFSTPVTIWSVVANEFVQNHCHNFFLNIALSGGIFYFFIICTYVFAVAHKINKGGNILILKVLTYTIGCYLLLGTSEIVVNVMPVFFPLMTLGYYSKNLENFRIVAQ